MRLSEIPVKDLHLSADLIRSGSAKTFEDHLKSSIMQVGLAEPLKVAPDPTGGFTVIDGALRLRAINQIRMTHPSQFETVPAYVLDYNRRFEIRFQSDIYQDLLPSQLAVLVEHLHRVDNILKVDIARYIGISPATLRNYTGLWRLMERGGLFAQIVSLMDVGVFPASNPYAWLRLTDAGLEQVLQHTFAGGGDPESWIRSALESARHGGHERFPLKYVESVTSALPAACFRVGENVRAIKQDLGLRRAVGRDGAKTLTEARAHLARIAKESDDPVILSAAGSMQNYLA